MADKFLRLLAMLEQIPRAPYKRAPAEIRAGLAELGYKTDVRSVQRDLESLSGRLPIEADRRNKPYGWHWSASARLLNLPRMNPAEAVTYRLVGMFLDRLLPRSMLTNLKPHMDAAERVLEILPSGGLKDWTQKVRLLSPGQPLLPPEIQPAALANLYDALLTNSRISARYRPAGQSQPRIYKELNPLAMVLRGQVIYFVCTVADHADVLQFAAHRFKEVELLDKVVNRPTGFDLDRYIEEHNFDFASGETFRLELKLQQFMGKILEETPLSKDQKIRAIDAEWSRLTATVANTGQLRWWLLSFGSNVEIVRPASLRKELGKTCWAMARLYEQ